MISHGNILAFLSCVWNHEIGGFKKDDVYLSFLPLPHLMERCVTTCLLYGGSFCVFYSGDLTKIKDDAALVKPTIFIGVPRLFNRIVDGVKEKFE